MSSLRNWLKFLISVNKERVWPGICVSSGSGDIFVGLIGCPILACPRISGKEYSFLGFRLCRSDSFFFASANVSSTFQIMDLCQLTPIGGFVSFQNSLNTSLYVLLVNNHN